MVTNCGKGGLYIPTDKIPKTGLPVINIPHVKYPAIRVPDLEDEDQAHAVSTT